jgi:hypothetical protein
MHFDVNQTLNGMATAIAGVVAGEWPKIKKCIEKALQDEKDALNTIATSRLSGEIDDKGMESQLEDEKEVLKAALLACKVEAKVSAQNAVNAAIKVLTDAIKTGIKII